MLLDAFERSAPARDLFERLPARGNSLSIGGLAGSSGAVLAATLVRASPQRLVVIVTPTPADAERWLTDLQFLSEATIALYPQREALGEDEPHYEIAGERVGNHRGPAWGAAAAGRHHGARHRGTDAGAGRAGGESHPAGQGNPHQAAGPGAVTGSDGIPTRHHRHRGRRVQRTRWHCGCLRFRHGIGDATGVVGQRGVVASRL